MRPQRRLTVSESGTAMSPEELAKIATAERETRATFRHSLNVCTAAGCLSLHSDAIKDSLEAQVKSRGLDGQCKVRGVGCMGLCAAGPLEMMRNVVLLVLAALVLWFVWARVVRPRLGKDV